jgi:hypothetical protein
MNLFRSEDPVWIGSELEGKPEIVMYIAVLSIDCSMFWIHLSDLPYGRKYAVM